MSGFSEEIMRERLQRLTNTAPSIQTLSLWLIHHQKKHANVILETWLKEVKGHNSTERLIALTNLANDVIQNCRKKSPQFMKIFLDVLQPGFSHMSEVGDDNCRRAIKRVLQVWRDRCIYTSEELESLSQCLTDIEGLSSPTEPLDIKASPNGAIVDVDPPPTTSSEGVQKSKVDYKNFQKISTNLVGLLKKIGDPPSADEKTRRMIAAYPESIANPSLLRKIDTMEAAEELMEKITEAQPIVHAYCARLKNELADRRSAQKLFDDYMKALEESAERNLHLIDSVRQKINRLEAEKKEIAKHIESLPDLNEMLGSSSSSLPTLGELFT